MDDGQVLLGQIAADPSDVSARLVYADWLEERGDPKAVVWRRGMPLASVLACPDDDVPRLAYADWAEASGDPERAEFVRIQLEIGNQRDPARGSAASEENGRRQDYLERRQHELLASGLWRWLPEPLIESWFLGRPMDTFQRFRRGFVEEISCRMSDFVLHGRRLREAMPLRAVTLTRLLEEGDPLLAGFNIERLLEPGIGNAATQLGWMEQSFPGIRFLPDPTILPRGYGCGTAVERVETGRVVGRHAGGPNGMLVVVDALAISGGSVHPVGVAINDALPGRAVLYWTSSTAVTDEFVNDMRSTIATTLGIPPWLVQGPDRPVNPT